MNKSKPLIGELLKSESFISSGMLDFALNAQSSDRKKRLGEILKSLGLVTDVELAKVLAKQAGLKYFSMEKCKPEASVLAKIPYQYASKYNIVPILSKDSTTTVAIGDPFSSQAIQYAKQFVGTKAIFVTAPVDRLKRTVENEYYLANRSIKSEIEKIQLEIRRGENLRTADLIQLLNHTALDLNASDMHVSTTGILTFVSYRVDGVLQLLYSFPAGVHSKIVSAFKLGCGMDISESMRPQDGKGSFELRDDTHELRASTLPTVSGENLVVRFLTASQEFRSVEDLGFREDQLNAIMKHLNTSSGVILCTGPTGSGKTTTLYGLVRRTNYLERNVLTIEDPVELRIPLINQVKVNEKAGITFTSAVKSFLRQDPDIMLVGEIRDEETAMQTIRAAQTGHLLLSSLHTNDAIGSVARLRDLGVGNYLIASTLSCVIAQRLVRRLCPACKTKVKVDDETVSNIGLSSNVIYRSKGCDHCHGMGYLGRIAVAEILEFSTRLRTMIENGESPMALRQQMRDEGIVTLREGVARLVKEGSTDDLEFSRVVFD